MSSKYTTLGELCSALSPDKQFSVCNDETKCFTDDRFPTLNMLRTVYGKQAPHIWLVPQLFNLSEYCGCRNKLTDMQLVELALIIAQEYYFLKVSEIMLFFFKFKAGRYGKFYGSVDPMTITSALNDFMKDRNAFFEKNERKITDEKAKADVRNTMSYTEYVEFCRKNGLPEPKNIISAQQYAKLLKCSENDGKPTKNK